MLVSGLSGEDMFSKQKSLKKCLIVGASGFIGSYLVKSLRDDWKIFALSLHKSRQITKEGVIWIKADLSRDTKLNLPKKIDSVIYLAQSKYFRDFPKHAVDVFQVNTNSVLKLLDYARKAGARSFIFASSGNVDKILFQKKNFRKEYDAHFKNYLKFYQSTKLCSEMLIENYRPYMNTIVLRLFFVYGPGQKQEMLLPRLIKNVRGKKPVILYGNNGIKINPIYVSDAAEAICCALKLNKSCKIDIAGPRVYSLRQICEIIGENVGRKPIFDVRLDMKYTDIVGDISMMSKILTPPKIPFEEGINYIL